MRRAVEHLHQAGRWIDFGQQPLHGAAVRQHAEHARGHGFHQAARQLLPDALRHQCVDLAGLDHLAHQGHGFGRDAERVEARGEAGHAQDPHRVFAEGIRHMAQHLVAQVALPGEGVDQCCLVGFSAASASSDGRAIALIVRSRRARSSSSVTSGEACTTKPR